MEKENEISPGDIDVQSIFTTFNQERKFRGFKPHITD